MRQVAPLVADRLHLHFDTFTVSAIFAGMETVDEILRLEDLLQDLAQQRAGLAGRPVELDAVDTACRVADDELRQLIASMSLEDEAWLEVQRAGIRHGVSGDRFH